MGCSCAKPEPKPAPSPAGGGAGGGAGAAAVQHKVFDGPRPVLYYMAASPPSRSALVTARQLGVDLDIRLIDLFAGEHLSEDFVKINPQHTVPTLDDNGFILWESRAICTYLANKYGDKDGDDFYPRDERRRAMVDRRLYFDATTLYAAVSDLVKPLFTRVETRPSEAKKKQVVGALELLETFLADSTWVAGESMTVADTVIVASVTSAQAIGVDMSRYRNISAWLGRCRTHMRGFEENAAGAKVYGQMLHGLLGEPVFAPSPPPSSPSM